MSENYKIRKIVNGLWNGTVKLISNPNDGCLACQIGDYWFCFIGSDDENLTPEEAKKNYDVFTIAKLILEAIDDIKNIDEDEHSYYYSVLGFEE